GITIDLKARWRIVEYALKSRLRKSEILGACWYGRWVQAHGRGAHLWAEALSVAPAQAHGRGARL
ncbi:hypothetical protein A2U01_0100491, partial [Trifolium medium]|nr:hypothetical protein [Trifolium medium]